MKTKSIKSFRKLLRLKIVEHFGSQAQLAYISGIDEAILSKLVNGVRDPAKDQASLLSKLLKTPENQLFIKSDAN